MHSIARAAAIAAGLVAFQTTATFAVSLEGQPIEVNTVPSGTYDIQTLGAIDLPGGGFGAVWSENTGGFDAQADQIKVRWYRSNRAPFGPAARVDAKVAGQTPRSLSLMSGVPVGDEHLIVWQANIKDNDNELAGRFYDNRKPDGPPIVLDNASAVIGARFPTILRNGTALVVWTRATPDTRSFGRIVKSSTNLGTPGVNLNIPGWFHSSTSSLDVGFINTYVQSLGDERAIGAQVYNAKGKIEGDFIELTEPVDVDDIGFWNAMGLTNGNFVFVRLVPKGNGSKGDLTARVYTRAGNAVSPQKTLMTNLPMDVGIAITYLPNTDFLVAMVRDAAGGKRYIEYARFNKNLKQVGVSAKTNAAVGLVRGGFRLLSNDKLASSYRVGNQIFLQIVKP